MAVVNIRGDRLYHEHIHWDSASALRQVGLLPEYVPLPERAAVNGEVYGHGPVKPVSEVRLPVYGTEGAAKMRNKNSILSNEMFGWGVRDTMK